MTQNSNPENLDNQDSKQDSTIDNIIEEFETTIDDEQPAENIDDLKQKISELEAQSADFKDKMVRAVAESENIRKRASIDVAKASDFAIEKFANDMVSVLDNLYRAIDNIPNDEDLAENQTVSNIKQGIEITQKEMINAFERNKIVRIYPKGDKFNPDLHQAMSQVPSEEVEPNNIIDVIQAGYTIKNRLLRPALVIVAKKA